MLLHFTLLSAQRSSLDFTSSTLSAQPSQLFLFSSPSPVRLFAPYVDPQSSPLLLPRTYEAITCSGNGRKLWRFVSSWLEFSKTTHQTALTCLFSITWSVFDLFSSIRLHGVPTCNCQTPPAVQQTPPSNAVLLKDMEILRDLSSSAAHLAEQLLLR